MKLEVMNNTMSVSKSTYQRNLDFICLLHVQAVYNDGWCATVTAIIKAEEICSSDMAFV